MSIHGSKLLQVHAYLMLLSFREQYPDAKHLAYTLREKLRLDEVVVFLDQDLGQGFGTSDQESFLVKKSGIVE